MKAGQLDIHDSFKLSNGTKIYTVHDKVISNPSEGGSNIRQFYIVAVCDDKWFVFDYDKEVNLQSVDTKELLQIISNMGFVYCTDPKTIFVEPFLEEDDLPKEVKTLRNKHGFIIQTEIR